MNKCIYKPIDRSIIATFSITESFLKQKIHSVIPLLQLYYCDDCVFFVLYDVKLSWSVRSKQY